MNKFIPTIHAADIPLGSGITGTGPFQAVLDQGATQTHFTIGGLKWITAGGDKAKVSEAQTQMTQAAIGLIVIVVSFFIIGIVGAVLGIDILNPFKTLFG